MKEIQYVSSLVLGKQGRIVIPAKIREMLELKEGDTLAVECHIADGIIRMYPVFLEGLKK